MTILIKTSTERPINWINSRFLSSELSSELLLLLF